MTHSELPKEEVSRPIHEELSFLMVVCPNLNKEMIFNQIWFYFEFISKSITEATLLNPTKPPITDRCFEYICTVVSLVATEICNRYFDEYDRSARFNSSLAFFVRDLVGVLSRNQVCQLIKIYHELTNDTIRSNVGVCHRLRLQSIFIFFPNSVKS